MPFTDTPFNQFSDLVQNEPEGPVGINRKVITVTGVADAALPVGTVVVRPIGADSTVPYTILDDNADVVITNEFAVTFGGNYSYDENYTFLATGANSVVAFVGGYGLILKDTKIKLVNSDIGDGTGVLTAGQFANLVLLLERQGIKIEAVGPIA